MDKENNGFGSLGMVKTLESDSCELPYTARGHGDFSNGPSMKQ